MIWQNVITHNGYAPDADTSQAVTPASIGSASVGLSGTHRACPPPSRRKRRS